MNYLIYLYIPYAFGEVFGVFGIVVYIIFWRKAKNNSTKISSNDAITKDPIKIVTLISQRKYEPQVNTHHVDVGKQVWKEGVSPSKI